MPPLPSPLIIASHNQGKIREIAELLAPLKIQVESASEHDLPEPEETGDTFEANAAIKSESACVLGGHAALADDSGLCVPVLDGAPGIYSARWAGPNKDFSVAMQRIHDEIAAAGHDPQGAAAYFVCVLSLSIPQRDTLFFRGEIHGTLTFPARGDNGFGYDPIFIPEGHTVTFGEMDANKKHDMSHRARAFKLLLDHLHQGEHAA